MRHATGQWTACAITSNIRTGVQRKQLSVDCCHQITLMVLISIHSLLASSWKALKSLTSLFPSFLHRLCCSSTTAASLSFSTKPTVHVMRIMCKSSTVVAFYQESALLEYRWLARICRPPATSQLFTIVTWVTTTTLSPCSSSRGARQSITTWLSRRTRKVL